VFKLKSKFGIGAAKPYPTLGKPLFEGVRTVFLDRDGILNEKMPEGLYVTRWIDFQVLPGVPAALRKLNDAGLTVVVVSNQRGIAQGLCTPKDVDGIHASFRKLLEGYGARVDAFFVCPHEIGKCNCRKPLPGLYQQAAAQFPAIKPEESVMVGDSLCDMEFGRNLGMKTILVEGNPERRAPGAEEAERLATRIVASLPQAVDEVLGLKQNRE
jgi:D-glycero-D-manno-heptose 1,7-bisphosphate phosphatase